jgi:hypothetical protein
MSFRYIHMKQYVIMIKPENLQLISAFRSHSPRPPDNLLTERMYDVNVLPPKFAIDSVESLPRSYFTNKTYAL